MANKPLKNITTEDLKNYFTGKIKCFYYEEAKEKYKEFLPHSDGAIPTDILKKQRPNEPKEILEFREQIWQPITKPTFTRLISSLSKIRRSNDWAINYPKETFGLIRDGETLEDYCEKDFPYFTSVTNWVFSVLLKQYLIDPNAVMLIVPLETDVEDSTVYLKPFPYIYNCEDVIVFEDGQYTILNIKSGCYYTSENSALKSGKSFYFVTANKIERWDQIDEKNNFAATWIYEHNLNFFPAFKLKGIICNNDHNDYLYESRIAGMLPNSNEAIAEYTDLQAGKRLHIYPERWESSQNECTKCKGTGKLVNHNWTPGMDITLRETRCGSCINGWVPSGPYSKIIVRPVSADQQPMPSPPAGFIEKDVEIIRIMDESVDKHIYKALAAINFQFLEQTPLNQSGTAKEVDKEELNNTVHSIAEDIIASMDSLYKSIAYYRYSIPYPDLKAINKMIPTIPVPEHFDLISSEYMQDEIKRSREAKINPLLISEMEVEYSARRFSQNEDINILIKLINQLDPLPGSTEDEKMSMLSNGGITKSNYIISSNIVNFIRRAMFENDSFIDMGYDEQKEILNQYAEEQIESTDAAKEIIDDATKEEANDIEEPELSTTE